MWRRLFRYLAGLFQSSRESEYETPVYWKAIEPIWRKVSIYDGGERFLAEFPKISAKQKALYAAHWAQSEIRNGGLDQFFSNSTGVLAPEAVEGYRALGMHQTAAVIEEALEFFGDPYPRDREVRIDALGEAWEDADKSEMEFEEDYSVFDELDNRFFELIDTEAGGFEAVANAFAVADKP